MQRIWEKDFPLRVYEVGCEGRVSLPNLMNLFQDAASEHAAHLGAGFPQLAPRGLSWFATRYHVQIRRYPVYGETIRVKTWPKAKKRLFTQGFRDRHERAHEQHCPDQPSPGMSSSLRRERSCHFRDGGFLQA
ncbi:MAG: thioesterase [Thermovirgaceae bacterium]|nr:thioesterase [Thermovirgaceae bacterium]